MSYMSSLSHLLATKSERDQFHYNMPSLVVKGKNMGQGCCDFTALVSNKNLYYYIRRAVYNVVLFKINGSLKNSFSQTKGKMEEVEKMFLNFIFAQKKVSGER